MEKGKIEKWMKGGPQKGGKRKHQEHIVLTKVQVKERWLALTSKNFEKVKVIAL